MAWTGNKKAFCVLEFARTESIVTVLRRFRTMYHVEPPTDKTIREWYMTSSRLAACAVRNEQAGRGHRPRLSSGYEKHLSGALRSQYITRAGIYKCLCQVFGAFCANIFAKKDTGCSCCRRGNPSITILVYTSAWISNSGHRKTGLLRSWFSVTRRCFMCVCVCVW